MIYGSDTRSNRNKIGRLNIYCLNKIVLNLYTVYVCDVVSWHLWRSEDNSLGKLVFSFSYIGSREQT